jgi:hypothetical protein
MGASASAKNGRSIWQDVADAVAHSRLFRKKLSTISLDCCSA